MFCDSDYAPVRRCNVAPLSYFETHRYTDDNINAVCSELDKDTLFTRLTFKGNGEIDFRLSQRTYDVQGGHVATVAKYFLAAANQPCLSDAKGSLIVWLEDGFWEWHQKYAKAAPILSFGRHSSDTRSFLIPDPAFMGSGGYVKDLRDLAEFQKDNPFESRAKTVYFRGAASGCGIEDGQWRTSPRGRVMVYASELADRSKLDAALTKLAHLPASQRDMFIGLGMVAPVVPFDEFLRYRYLLNVDGYCCAWISLFTKLASSSLVVKVDSEYSQWYYEDLTPWRHYVPVKNDLSDFLELYEWMVTSDAEVKQIVQNANTAVAEIDFETSVDETALLIQSILQCRKT